MRITAELTAPCPPHELFHWVSDLALYPSWLGLVERAVPEEPSSAEDAHPAWIVDLTGRIGPLARSKRLRMVRSRFEPHREVSFERRERGRQDHAAWVLTAHITETDSTTSHLEMELHYGGRLWGPVLEPILNAQIEQGRQRLLQLVTNESGPT